MASTTINLKLAPGHVFLSGKFRTHRIGNTPGIHSLMFKHLVDVFKMEGSGCRMSRLKGTEARDVTNCRSKGGLSEVPYLYIGYCPPSVTVGY